MIKRKIFEVIQPDCKGSILSRIVDWILTVLILASVVVVFAVTFDLPCEVITTLESFESIASIIFTVEYLLRIWTADFLHVNMSPWKARTLYVLSTMALIDLVAILPFWLPMFLPGSLLGMRALRLVRLLRIFKLNRYFDAMATIGAVIRDKRRELIGSLFFVLLLMLVASLLMYSVEHDAQPQVFRNAFSGLWWAVATLTTVGYGDIYPVTVVGRVLGAVIAFSGIAALAIPTGIITAGLTARIDHCSSDDRGFDREVRDQLQILKKQNELLSIVVGKLKIVKDDAQTQRGIRECETDSVSGRVKMFAVLVLLFGLFPQTAYSGFVKGHFRKNGTYVRGYYRSSKGSSSVGHGSSAGIGISLSPKETDDRPEERIKSLFGFDIGDMLIDRSDLQTLKDGSFKKKMKLKLKPPFDVWSEVLTYYTKDDYLLYKMKMLRVVQNPDEEKMQRRMDEIVKAIQQKFHGILTIEKCGLKYVARFSRDIQQQMSVGIEKDRDANGKPTASFVFAFEDNYYSGDQSSL